MEVKVLARAGFLAEAQGLLPSSFRSGGIQSIVVVGPVVTLSLRSAGGGLLLLLVS